MLADRADPTGKMAVLLACDSLDLGGAERHVANLATSLQGAGHRVSIACSAEGALAPMLRESGVAVHPLGDRLVKRRADDAYTEHVRRVIQRERPDVVHAHMHASVVAAATAVRDSSIPLVVTEHSEATWRDERAWLEASTAYARAHAVVAVSTHIAKRLHLATGIDNQRIHVIRNALHSPITARPAASRRPDGRWMIGVVARLVPEKGVDIFLLAAAAMAKTLPRACFVIVGDGPERAALERLAERLGIRSRVGFLGARADAGPIIQRLDVLCVPSRTEGTPLVVLEAMALGTPIVAAAVGGIPEQVHHRRHALLVTPGDEFALAATVRTVLHRRGLARRITEGAYRRALRDFSPERMVASVESLYRACLREAEEQHEPAALPLSVPVTA